MSDETGAVAEALRAELEASRARFLELVNHLRPDLHRYCARMMGSILDGEDVVQDTLATAYFKMPMLHDGDQLRPWLFRVAHNRCIDALRRRRGREVPLEERPEPATVPVDSAERRQQVAQALDRVVLTLPPKERACVLLKDVLGYALTEIAEIVDSTLGGVKAALHRARGKLAEIAERPAVASPPTISGDRHRLLQAYVDRFNAQDWDAVVALIRADARLEVVEVYEGQGRQAFTRRYFHNYPRLPFRWRFSLAILDGEEIVISWRPDEQERWQPYRAARIELRDGAVLRVRDYLHAPDYLLQEAHLEHLT